MIWNDEQMVGLDFETSGTKEEFALQPWRVASGDAWITSCALLRMRLRSAKLKLERVGPELNPHGFRDVHHTRRHREIVHELKKFFCDARSQNLTIVGWNIQFDIQWLLALGLEEDVFSVKWLDGMLLWRHYFIEPEYDTVKGKKKSYGLKAAVAEYLPQYAGYADDVDFHDESPEARAILDKYNVRDTRFTLILARHFYNLLAEEPQRLKCALIEAACLPMVAKANIMGMVVDTIAAHELQQWLIDKAATQLKILAPHGVTEAIVRSPVQLATLLYDKWGLPVLKENEGKKTGKISRATDKEVLHELAFIDTRAKDLRLYREALNCRTKFADTPLISAEYNEDGRTRPAAIVFGTYSGRLTYSSDQKRRYTEASGRNRVEKRQTGFALHQEKREKEYRNIIAAPPGYTLMEFDASGQEFRWMAIASKDQTMLDLCAPGEDPHGFMGSRLVQRDYREMVAAVEAGDKSAKDGRQLGKVANLSLQYRTSARKLRTVARVQYLLPMELPEAERIHKTYQNTYPGVPVYWKLQIQQTRRSGYVETFAGRRVQVTGDWSGSQGWSMGSTAINYRIQGTGADQKYLAMRCLRPYLVQIGAYFAWDLHDGIYMFVPDDKVERAKRDIQYLLTNLPYEKAWGFSPPIPLPWDCKVGKSWGALKEWKGE